MTRKRSKVTPIRTRRVAVLDDKGRLVDVVEVGKEEELPEAAVDIDPGDLPLDGSYKYVKEQGAFFPLGHAMPLITSKPPVTEQMVLYQLVRAMGKDAPKDCRDWCDWYEANLLRRDEERADARRRK